MIYGIVIDEQMRDKVKVTVIATGFQRRATLPVTPVDLSNYRSPDSVPAAAAAPAAPGVPLPAPAQAAAPQANPSSFYRKTPQHPLAAAPATDTANLDVPTFLRKQGAG